MAYSQMLIKPLSSKSSLGASILRITQQVETRLACVHCKCKGVSGKAGSQELLPNQTVLLC